MKHTELKTKKHLANYLNCEEDFIIKALKKEYIIWDTTEENGKNESSYDTFVSIGYEELVAYKLYIKKKSKSGGFREVYSVYPQRISDTLKILNNRLTEIYSPTSCVHGFVKGRNTKTNAIIHLAKNHLLSIDIENFFGSISVKMIESVLIQNGFDTNIAKWIAHLTTIEGYLVQGFNTSPVLANMVVQKMDNDFNNLCGDEINYTRYADDLYFSSNHELPAVSEFEEIVTKYGFRLNQDKTSYMKRGRNQYVTGLTVFDNKTPRIPKKIKRNLRLEVYYICKYGYDIHATRRLKNLGGKIEKDKFRGEIQNEITQIQHNLFGWLHYIGSIEPQFANSLLEKLKNAKRHVNIC